jgi:trk system potassium uptake protein TrkA
MKIVIIGAGQVGHTIVESLHDEHDLTVIDLDADRLDRLGAAFDVATLRGNGASRQLLLEAGVPEADMLIACTSRDEVNLVAAMLSKAVAPATLAIVRATNVEYLEAWQERQLNVDFIVSSEMEAAHAVSRIIGVPAAVQTDVFADGQVQIVEFDVGEDVSQPHVVGVPLREARVPPDSKVAGIIRGQTMILPKGEATILPGDRIVVIGSPHAAREWSALLSSTRRTVEGVVVFGGGKIGAAVARVLHEQEIDVRVIESDLRRARDLAEELPHVRIYHAAGVDAEFLERERIGNAHAAVLAMRDDARNLYAATIVKMRGVVVTIAVAHEPESIAVFDRAGVDVAINPRLLTAEEIVRFTHDPRTQQVAMLDGDRFEVLDIVCNAGSRYVGQRFKEMPIHGALIGAIVREGHAIFPHGEDELLPGDRVIVFTEAARAREVERAL